MRIQWSLILMLIFALITAIFAVINVNPVEVNFLFGYANVPLVLLILGSALFGGLIVGLFGIYRQFRLHREMKKLRLENEQLQKQASVPAAVVPPAPYEPTVSSDPAPLEPISGELGGTPESRGFRTDKS
ncbi:lipopolysaccharide assembly protein LapA domain-containing protein [Saccharibacillus sp. CPCC 101409]|uniref:LapA family protein n=1 Tax=Saccharibacillus sp. CPCC 101409 TaxID=3058041 RepID=UPI002671B825|nr:lipopolysaccharide assembly protein LapA domain-containing protein [Saccharibacillus sp. CPCC 101409]MDO3410918.1 lipopolysaccharide assembly protein LapA domain-containing protein [Saccharibacillus sp. CPCC 101409]